MKKNALVVISFQPENRDAAREFSIFRLKYMDTFYEEMVQLENSFVIFFVYFLSIIKQNKIKILVLNKGSISFQMLFVQRVLIWSILKRGFTFSNGLCENLNLNLERELYGDVEIVGCARRRQK